jgi:cullin 3
LKRIKVPLISAKEVTVVEVSEIPPTVEEDRRHLVEASIVRAMKSRKKLSHNELIAEISRQLSMRFAPTPQLIKKRVESLIEREYLARDIDDPRVYVYLA